VYSTQPLPFRIKLEEKYLDDLALLTSNIQESCVPNEQSLIQKSFVNYVGLADINKPHKQQHIDQLKVQYENMIKFRVRKLEIWV
jgi:hypothetical protein